MPANHASLCSEVLLSNSHICVSFTPLVQSGCTPPGSAATHHSLGATPSSQEGQRREPGSGGGAVRQGRDAGRQWKRRGAGGDPGSRRAAGPRAFSQAHSLVEPLLTSPGLLGPASTQQASGRAELQSEGTPPLPRSVPAIRGAGRDLPASPNTLTTIAERFSHHNTQDRQEWGKQVWLLGAGLRVQDVLAQMGSSCCTDPEGSLPA